MENVIPEDQANLVDPDELPTEEKGLRQRRRFSRESFSCRRIRSLFFYKSAPGGDDKGWPGFCLFIDFRDVLPDDPEADHDKASDQEDRDLQCGKTGY